jgi:hypothetical protein
MPPLPELTPEQEAESNLGRIMGIASTLHVLALIFVAIRMYTRFVIVKAPKIDDAFMLLATVHTPWNSLNSRHRKGGLTISRVRSVL